MLKALLMWVRWRRRLPAIQSTREHAAAEGMGYYLAYCVAEPDRKLAIAARLIRTSRYLDRLAQLERGFSPWTTAQMPEAEDRALQRRILVGTA